MARINIEDSIWSDSRFQRLTGLLGDNFKAVGVMVMAWKLAQKFWCPDKQPIPERDFIEAGLPKELIIVGLADNTPDGIYIRGSEQHFKWWFDKVEAGRKGGLKKSSAAKQLLASASENTEKPKQNVPSYSISSSSSSSISPSRERATPSLLDGLVGIEDGFFQGMTLQAQESWVKEFGIEFLRSNVPHYYSCWVEEKPQDRYGNIRPAKMWVRNCLTNHRKYNKEDEPINYEEICK